MAHALGRSAALEELLEIAAEEALIALEAASVSISRLEPDLRTVRTLINVGELGPGEERWPENETYAISESGNLARVMGQLHTWTGAVEDLDCDPWDRELLLLLDKASGLGAPVLVDGGLWGEIYATRSRDSTPFGEDHRAYVEVLIAILGAAVSRSLREETLESMAFRDGLTGLLNRRALDEEAARVFDVPPGESRQVTVVALDLNGLKHVNDTFGHSAGDTCIESVARALQAAFTDLCGSVVARSGGDEFTVLVSGQPPDDVVGAVNAVCQRTWKHVTGAAVSAGVASVVLTSESTTTPGELFAAADGAQYVAKRARLWTAVLADGHQPPTHPGLCTGSSQG